MRPRPAAGAGAPAAPAPRTPPPTAPRVPSPAYLSARWWGQWRQPHEAMPQGSVEAVHARDPPAQNPGPAGERVGREEMRVVRARTVQEHLILPPPGIVREPDNFPAGQEFFLSIDAVEARLRRAAPPEEAEVAGDTVG